MCFQVTLPGLPINAAFKYFFLVDEMACWNTETTEYTQLEKESKNEEKDAVNAPFYSTLTYSWLSKTLSVGYKRPLELEDLPRCMGEESSQEIAEEFENTWSSELKNSQSKNRPPNLWTTVIRSIGYWNLTLSFSTAVVSSVCRVLQLVLLMAMLTLMTEGIRDFHLWLATSGYIIALVVEIVAKNQYFYISQQRIRTRITSGLIALVYQKVSPICSSLRSWRFSGRSMKMKAAETGVEKPFILPLAASSLVFATPPPRSPTKPPATQAIYVPSRI